MSSDNILIKSYKDEPTIGSLRIRNTGSYWRLERFQFVPLEGDIWVMIAEYALSDLGESYVRDEYLRLL